MAVAAWRTTFLLLLIDFSWLTFFAPDLVSGWKTFDCLNRKGRDYQITALGWEEPTKTLYAVTDQEVIRVKPFEIVRFPSNIQRGEVTYIPAGKRRNLKPGNLIGIFKLESILYAAHYEEKNRSAYFSKINAVNFDFNQLPQQYVSKLNAFVSKKQGAKIVAQMGVKMLAVYYEEDSNYVEFVEAQYTDIDLHDLKFVFKRERSDSLKLKAATWAKRQDDRYYYMLGYTYDNDAIVWGGTIDLINVAVQNRFWPGKLFGCHRTLCEGGRLENIFYDPKTTKHIMIVDGGQIALDSLDTPCGELIPTDFLASANQVFKPIGTAFTYKNVHYAYWNNELYTLEYTSNKVSLSKSVSEEVKKPFMLFIESIRSPQLAFTCAVQIGFRLALFTPNAFTFMDEIQNGTATSSMEVRMKENRAMFNLPDTLTILNCYFDFKTKTFFFFTDYYCYRVPEALMNAEKGKLEAPIEPMALHDMWACERKELPFLNEYAKYALYGISGTLAFIMLVICCVFHQLSRKKGRGGIGEELRRMSRNRPNRRSSSKWSSGVSSSGSYASRSVIPSTTSSGSRSSRP